MKTIYYGLFSLVLMAFFMGYGTPPAAVMAPQSASATQLEDIRQTFHRDLDDLLEHVHQYRAALETFQRNKQGLRSLQSVHLSTRMAFKRAEYLLEYFDTEAVKKILNGPPLPSLEPSIPSVVVLQPHGLQVLDELVFEDLKDLDLEAIDREIAQLESQLPVIIAYQKSLRLEHRHVMEAVKLELIRIVTLGLTGFDTPGSVAALPEASTALASLQSTMTKYTVLAKGSELQSLEHIIRLLAEAQQSLQGQEFDSFNRAAFIRSFFNPLNTFIWQFQQGMGIEGLRETAKLPPTAFLEDAPLFSERFFNTNFYQRLETDAAMLDAQAKLGRVLFYDPILSVNLQRSCASCHRPEKAFTDGLATSLALDGEHHILRNSPTLLNSVFAERFFYDLRENQPSRQVRHVITDANEFGMDYLSIIERLKLSKEYQERFAQAYPEAGISAYSISHAMATYTAGLTSFNSPFDLYIRGEAASIAPEVERGFNLFMGKAACGTCHFAPTFSGLVPPLYKENESEVLGVPVRPDTGELDGDEGRIRSGRPQDESEIYRYSFKTTTVRNVALTAPYMHNGAFPDLQSVLEFYNKGGGAGLGIHLPNQTLPTEPLQLNDQEMSDIIKFMEALTDTQKAGSIPKRLPEFEGHPEWNQRVPGGVY